MDWPLAIERNRDVLMRILASLFVLAGIAAGGTAASLPRHVYRAVLAVLRPAEAAMRRLIIIAARGLVLKPRPARAAPIGLVPRGGDAVLRAPCFELFDPLKLFVPAAAPHSAGPVPRISVPGLFNPAFLALPQVPSSDDPVAAAQLCRRLNALQRVLDNLPNAARRLARWRALRDLALKGEATFRSRRMSPMRPGRPPGARKRSIHAVDEILRECHALALDILSPPRNTS